MLSTVLLSAACVAASAPQFGSITLRPAQTIAIPGELSTRFGFASDDQYDYVATPHGLFRSSAILGAPLQPVAAAGVKLNNVAVNGGALYVLRHGEEVRGDRATEHTLLRSLDRGATFENIDAGLEDCYYGYCLFLPATEIEFAPGRIFLGAGGNVLVSADNAASWNILQGVTEDGNPAPQSCPTVFHRVGQRLFIGGECPLDFGFLRAGELQGDLLGWKVPPGPISTPEMENRNVQFVRSAGGAILAGIEGAILKSCDGGSSFKYVVHYPLSGGLKYPYIHQILAPSRYPGLLIAGGFDKANLVPYLAWSGDYGEMWTDVSSLALEGTVSLLAESRDGRPLVVIQESGRAVVQEIVPVAPSRRRRTVNSSRGSGSPPVD